MRRYSLDKPGRRMALFLTVANHQGSLAMNESDPLAIAREFGLHRLADGYPDEVAEAAAFARLLAKNLPRGLAPTEEPAHVYRVKDKS